MIRSSRRLLPSGLPLTGTSERFLIFLAFASRDTRTCIAFLCLMIGKAILCARIIPWKDSAHDHGRDRRGLSSNDGLEYGAAAPFDPWRAARGAGARRGNRGQSPFRNRLSPYRHREKLRSSHLFPSHYTNR